MKIYLNEKNNSIEDNTNELEYLENENTNKEMNTTDSDTVNLNDESLFTSNEEASNLESVINK